MNLTNKQLETLNFMKTYRANHGTVPTLKAIADSEGVTVQAIFMRFKQLVDRGKVTPAPMKRQGYEIND